MKLILIGFIVGIGKIIPGVSGAMLAMMLGVYEKVIDAVTNFFGDVRNNTFFLMKFGLGIILSIVIFSKFILFLLHNYYYETMYLFLGLILGTLIIFMKQLKFNKKNICLFLIFFGLTLSFTFFNFKINNSLNANSFYIVFLGFIDAVTSIIPGISGTVVYMVLGSYDKVLSILANPINIEFLEYGIGLFLGIIITCLVMKYLLKNKRSEVYSAIFAFMMASILGIFLKIIGVLSFNLVIFLIMGGIIGYYLQKS